MVKNEKGNCEIDFPRAHFSGTGSVSSFYGYVGSEIDKQVKPMPPGERRQKGRNKMENIMNAVNEYTAIVKGIAEDYTNSVTVSDIRNEHPELDFMDDEQIQEILQYAKQHRTNSPI